MKKLFSSQAILLTAAIFASTFIQAQQPHSQPSFKNANVTSSSVSESPSPVESSINKRALKSFDRNYPTSAVVKWHSSPESILATFRENGKLNRVFYRSNGRWLRTMTSYDQALLDDGIKTLVKEKFRNYEITSVTEIHEANLDCYFINIDSPKDFKVVIVYEGEVFVHKEFNK